MDLTWIDEITVYLGEVIQYCIKFEDHSPIECHVNYVASLILISELRQSNKCSPFYLAEVCQWQWRINIQANELVLLESCYVMCSISQRTHNS